MLEDSVLAYFESNWGWAAGLAASMMGLTTLAGLLNRQRKDEVALWLMGAPTEEGWAKSFTTLFDAVFGRRHLSLQCFLRSTLASLIAVVFIWLLMGGDETIGLRLQADLDLGTVLILGLAINVLADYVSLLETRLLLAHMPRRWLAQATILILDLLISAAIIWLAIFAYFRSPLHQGEIESFAEVLGVFSIFSVFFYSTFLTSVWTWVYVASTWMMRLAKRLRLADWLDVEHRPILVLSNVVGLVTFLGALALSGPLIRDEHGLTAADRTLCSVFKGRVCLDAAALASAQHVRVQLVSTGCGGNLGDCTLHRNQPDDAHIIACNHFGVTANFTLRYISPQGVRAELRDLDTMCSVGDAESCTSRGMMHLCGVSATQRGIIIGDPDPEDLSLAAIFLRHGCSDGSDRACTTLAQLHALGVYTDETE